MKTEIVKWTTKIGQEIAKNSPKILTGLAVAGTVTTAILAGKASIDAYKKLEELKEIEEGGHEPFTTKEKAVNILPIYIPTGIMVITTAACIIGSHEISARRQLALASAYSLSTEAMKEMQNKVEETYGKKKAEKLKDDIHHDHVIANPPTEETIIITGKGNTLCYDEYSGRYFRGDIEDIKRSINKLNADLLNGNWILLNDFYDLIGLKTVGMGEDWGWSICTTGPIDIRMSACLTEKDEPCLVLEYEVKPTFAE